MTTIEPQDSRRRSADSARLNAREKRNLSWLWLLLTAAATLTMWASYRVVWRAQVEAVRSELSQLARVAATQVDGDLHRTLVSPAQMGSPEHLRAIAPLVRLHRATRQIIYVYTLILREDGMHYVLGTDYVYRVPGDDLPVDPIMEPYTADDPDALRALRQHVQVTQETPVAEEHRSYLSAYAPFFDRNGAFVGVVGLDLWTQDLDARLAGIRHFAWGMWWFLFLLINLLTVVLYRVSLSRARARQAEEKAVRNLATALKSAEREAAAARRLALEATSSNHAKSEFLAMMSHEVRTPLHGVVGMIELMQTTPLDALQTRYLSTMQASSESLLRVINDVLDFSRIEAGKLDIKSEPVDVRDLAHRVVNLLRPQAGIKKLQLQLDVSPGVPERVMGDGGRLYQVLLNLISNAVKFTVEGRVQLLIVEEHDERIRFTVRDTGPGMRPDQVTGVFEPFEQFSEAGNAGKGGSGLGLAISQRLVALMGGVIEVVTQPGQGATFHFALPMPVAMQHRAGIIP